MTEHVNPKIITWARKRNGLTIEALAEIMKRDPVDISMWESGEKSPSYTTLEELAYMRFRIPLAVFFFPEPPEIEDPVSKFRRLPDYEMERLSPDTLQMIRLAQGYQDSLCEIADVDMLERQIFRDLDPRNMNPRQFAQKTRGYLGITIKQQFNFGDRDTAFKAWRHAIESAGIFTFKNSLKDRFISGFCLLDEHFPIIVINNSNAFARQIFTLAHELGHILYGIHGITDVDETYIRYMKSHEKTLEIKCNEYAAELLVPSEAFQKEIELFEIVGPTIIPKIADKYSVSREVILRRLLECGSITQEYYTITAAEWNDDYLRSRQKKGGGNWYLTRLAYLGEGFTRLAFESFNREQLTKMQLARHLNINARYIDKLQTYLG